MSGTVSGAGQVLGASTAIVGGVAMLPVTGHSVIGFILPVFSILCGMAILGTLVFTRLIKRIN